MSNPFKIAQPAAKNTNETATPIPAEPGKVLVHNRETGEPLPDASTDVKGRNATIPWPATNPLDGSKMPFKNLK